MQRAVGDGGGAAAVGTEDHRLLQLHLALGDGVGQLAAAAGGLQGGDGAVFDILDQGAWALLREEDATVMSL